MDFFDIGFIIFVPLLLLLICLNNTNRKFYCQVLAVINIMLLFNSWLVAKQLYNLYVMAKFLSVQPDTLNISIGWHELRLILIVVLPLLFLIKPLIANKWLSAVMFFLLSYTGIVYIIDGLTKKNEFYFSYFSISNFWFQLMNYCCWVIVVFVILRYFNYLPYSQKHTTTLD